MLRTVEISAAGQAHARWIARGQGNSRTRPGLQADTRQIGNQRTSTNGSTYRSSGNVWQPYSFLKRSSDLILVLAIQGYVQPMLESRKIERVAAFRSSPIRKLVESLFSVSPQPNAMIYMIL
jgi:hypothetical protein